MQKSDTQKKKTRARAHPFSAPSCVAEPGSCTVRGFMSLIIRYISCSGCFPIHGAHLCSRPRETGSVETSHSHVICVKARVKTFTRPVSIAPKFWHLCAPASYSPFICVIIIFEPRTTFALPVSLASRIFGDSAAFSAPAASGRTQHRRSLIPRTDAFVAPCA